MLAAIASGKLVYVTLVASHMASQDVSYGSDRNQAELHHPATCSSIATLACWNCWRRLNGLTVGVTLIVNPFSRLQHFQDCNIIGADLTVPSRKGSFKPFQLFSDKTFLGWHNT